MKKTASSVSIAASPLEAKVKCLLTTLLLFILSACALGPRMFNHSFSFDMIRDSADGKSATVEILDYQYGESRQFGTYTDKEDMAALALGRKRFAWGMYGSMQRGEFLYVKWRELATGTVYEDRVDLRERLLRDLEDLELRFVIRESQLYVFLIYPWDGKPWQLESPRNKFIPVPGGVKRYQGHKYVQIYPDPIPVKPD